MNTNYRTFFPLQAPRRTNFQKTREPSRTARSLDRRLRHIGGAKQCKNIGLNRDNALLPRFQQGVVSEIWAIMTTTQ
jgi:hypothetical protein